MCALRSVVHVTQRTIQNNEPRSNIVNIMLSRTTGACSHFGGSLTLVLTKLGEMSLMEMSWKYLPVVIFEMWDTTLSLCSTETPSVICMSPLPPSSILLGHIISQMTGRQTHFQTFENGGMTIKSESSILVIFILSDNTSHVQLSLFITRQSFS